MCYSYCSIGLEVNILMWKTENVTPGLQLLIKRRTTCDEKWIVYNNMEWKKSYGKRNEPSSTTLKAALTNYVKSDKYSSQLGRLMAAVNEKCQELPNRKSILFHHYNARPSRNSSTTLTVLSCPWIFILPLISIYAKFS